MKRLLISMLLSGPAMAEPQPLDLAGFTAHSQAAVELGHLLFYDPILSGNRSVSCATCHHPRFATGDGMALGLGDGGIGLGPERQADPDNLPEQRIPRNAPALFNIGHRDVTVMFHDGRIEVDQTQPNGLRTPLDSDMLEGFDSLLSAQTMFPVLSPDEMAGHYQENDVSLAVRQGRLTGDGGAWSIISDRVAAIPAYRTRFRTAYPDRDTIAFTDISNAIAAFVDTEWRATNSDYDRHLAGGTPLTGAAARGMDLFFGKANCSTCHSGPLLSDQRFHAMGAPQIGPGKAARFESHQRDDGRMRVTGRAEDSYAFRTPMLRNVTRTGPWGHAGAHDDLRTFLRDHATPGADVVVSLPDLPGAAPDDSVWGNPDAREDILAAVKQTQPNLSDSDLDALMTFLEALEDDSAIGGRLGVPVSVPSGLPVDR